MRRARGLPGRRPGYNAAVTGNRILAVSFALVLAVPCALGAVEVVPPSEVAPGTRGVCVTEMDGGERVRIPLTVLGTSGPAAPEGEMVLVRLDDPRFERTGIIAGMSGSPVYVDGRLLGALAFGWQFEREPIGGVTPFGRMEAIGGTEAAGPLPGRPVLTELMKAWRGGEPGRQVLDWLLPRRAEGQGSPLPLAALGASPAPVDWLAAAWRRMGWVAAPAAGREARPREAGPLRPGDMVAGILVSGDASLAVGGTVTEVRGDRVWAFGHPFLGAGRYAMPLARAHVLAVLPNLARSFKFFTVGEVLGAFEQDRTHGMGAVLGREAPMVPVTVRTGGRTYRYEALDHPVLLPLLTAYLTSASQAARGKVFGRQTLRCGMTLRWRDGSEAALGESFPGMDAPARAAAYVSAVVGYVEGSPFPHPPLESVAVTLEQVERVREIEVLRVVPERRTVHPGDVLPVRVTLRARGDEATRTRTIRVRIPEGTPRGALDLIVADGASWTDYDLRSRPLRPQGFGDELTLLGRLVPSTVLVAALEARTTGVALPGGTVAMPPSRALSLERTLGGAVRPVGRMVTARVDTPLPWPAAGAERIRLRVDGARRERTARTGEAR